MRFLTRAHKLSLCQKKVTGVLLSMSLLHKAIVYIVYLSESSLWSDLGYKCVSKKPPKKQAPGCPPQIGMEGTVFMERSSRL